MTAGGWLTLIFAVGGVTTLLSWCVYKVVSTPGASGHVHSQADIKPRDREED